MRQYEVMYVLRPDLEEEKIKANVARYSEVVTSFGGEVTKLQEMGKRRLAYEIQKFREGYYVLMNFKANADAVAEADRLMKINDDIIRFLFVREEK
ncbi:MULTISPECIES: 30S ribosomal protein S6 [Brevibacillus]|jgi:small subunit ribosomal protein S6|uniref:Small ribosomal subunit protein bS6 n=1 Tax=Brevibacillus borstelensis AK1 TaxID=1300222 RepID=M8DGU5_9BACL|nr:30S ribosomal protein S6 [Brevibacillus borstelensis]EMT52672.1 30S ribosomal protein S6 [Brevibacillus borstelensis AK1]KKX55056.1 30S ribosomal protein S6 [Brevibacillus borstelensis cifa_chp40]MBE5396072.1 30S ribosomal protein S6 [Brevibacillus borstelensis]MCM3472308.1 30S ribosomal protein S6 [Brevibacillus borstelensis]MCM3561401.1 30S ribosomal protein S6 [Brevibacillus borstelensis]